MNSFTLKKKRGIDDLTCEFAFIGNSQGDESVSNDIKVYKQSKGWMSFVFSGIDINDQEAINNEAKRRRDKNKAYIKKLKEENRYGEEYKLNIHITPNPIFDKPNDVRQYPKTPLESYKMIFPNDSD